MKVKLSKQQLEALAAAGLPVIQESKPKTKTILVCPDDECGSDRVWVCSTTAYYANTDEHFCHLNKTHDPGTHAGCTDCSWRGRRMNLKEKEVEIKSRRVR